MAWIDDVKNLHDWLKNEPADKDRWVKARLVSLANTGLGFYAEGDLYLSNGSIEGKMFRHDTKDRWDPTPMDGINDSYPFDPKSVEKIDVSINPATGAIKVHTLTYAQPVSVAGYNLVTGTTPTGGLGTLMQLTMSLTGGEATEPK